MNTVLHGKEAEKIARVYLCKQYPRARILYQPKAYDARPDFLVIDRRRRIFYEVKGTATPRNQCLVKLRQRADRYLFVVRDKPWVRDIAADEVAGWAREAIAAKRILHCWEGRRVLAFDRLVDRLRRYHVEQDMTDFRVRWRNDRSCQLEFAAPYCFAIPASRLFRATMEEPFLQWRSVESTKSSSRRAPILRRVARPLR